MIHWLLSFLFITFWDNGLSYKLPISTCLTPNGSEGFCRPAEECVGYEGSKPSNCVQGHICCPDGAVSWKKCHEYAQLVYDTDSAVSLMANSWLSSKKVDTCAIVAVPLIVGGEKTLPKEFPHQALMGYGDSRDRKIKWECGGSLISENFVLTAAHCVQSDYRPKFVRFGITNLNHDLENEQIYRIDKVVIHPQFNAAKKINDIALVKLSEDVEFTPHVRPACIDYGGLLEENRAIATGFGVISHGGKQSPDLLKVTLDILGKKVCNRAVKRQLKNGLHDTQICAGFIAGGKDTCQGDSGGPLQTIKQTPYCMYNVIGITSFGGVCGFEHSPAIYTRVWSYVPWIEAIVWPNEI